MGDLTSQLYQSDFHQFLSHQSKFHGLSVKFFCHILQVKFFTTSEPHTESLYPYSSARSNFFTFYLEISSVTSDFFSTICNLIRRLPVSSMPGSALDNVQFSSERYLSGAVYKELGRRILVLGRSQKAELPNAICFLYSVCVQKVVLAPSASIFLVKYTRNSLLRSTQFHVNGLRQEDPITRDKPLKNGGVLFLLYC